MCCATLHVKRRENVATQTRSTATAHAPTRFTAPHHCTCMYTHYTHLFAWEVALQRAAVRHCGRHSSAIQTTSRRRTRGRDCCRPQLSPQIMCTYLTYSMQAQAALRQLSLQRYRPRCAYIQPRWRPLPQRHDVLRLPPPSHDKATTVFPESRPWPAPGLAALPANSPGHRHQIEEAGVPRAAGGARARPRHTTCVVP